MKLQEWLTFWATLFVEITTQQHSTLINVHSHGPKSAIRSTQLWHSNVTKKQQLHNENLKMQPRQQS